MKDQVEREEVSMPKQLPVNNCGQQRDIQTYLHTTKSVQDIVKCRGLHGTHPLGGGGEQRDV